MTIVHETEKKCKFTGEKLVVIIAHNLGGRYQSDSYWNTNRIRRRRS